jgi:hypothetical protein
MTDAQITRFVSIASNELLRDIAVSNSKKWAWHRFHAKMELARRDMEMTFA